jgi:hypothetical protein
MICLSGGRRFHPTPPQNRTLNITDYVTESWYIQFEDYATLGNCYV